MNPIYLFGISNRNNLFNPYQEDVLMGYAINDTTGQPHTLSMYNVSGFIDISGSSGVQLSRAWPSAFYDKDKNYIKGIPNILNQKNVNFNVPPGAKYIRLSVSKSAWSSSLFSLYSFRKTLPQYKNDLSKDMELETNQRFYRTKLSGKISFIREDYDWINSQTFETELILNIQKSNDGGLSWDTDYFNGKFMKTDCSWDADNRKVSVKPDSLDNYSDVLTGLEKEYNLIELSPALTPVIIRKRPLIQLYVQGDSVLSCFIGGTYWEQSCDTITNPEDLKNKYYFALASQLREINITGSGNYDISGLYGGKDGTYNLAGNAFYMKYTTNVISGSITANYFIIYRTEDDAPLYITSISTIGPIPNGTLNFIPYRDSGATGSFQGDVATYNVWMRYLLDRDYLAPNNTYPVPKEDITDDNLNYNYCIGLIADVSYMSLNFSVEPSKYGRADSGLYFQPPHSISGARYYPIAKSRWRHASIWFAFSWSDWLFESQGRQPYVLRDCYDFASVIQVLLKQFSTGITHKATAEYSQFLYSNRNPISGGKFNLILSQKSNMLHGSLAQPAQKAPITLQDITNLLRDCYRCYWYIDEQNRFRIEHIEWFRNGGTYGGGTQLTADLTSLTNIRNGKKWGFATSTWDFDKVDMPERFQFKWMDDCTESFEGYPIEVLSKYVTTGKIEDVNVSKFTPDVDYMLMNPNAISQDGFALFAAVNENALPVGFSGDEFYNGYISTDGSKKTGSSSGQDGYGWKHTICDAISGQTYVLLDNTGSIIDTGVYWHFFDLRGNSMGRASTTSGTVTCPSGCYTLGLSFRYQTDATPTSLPVLTDYSYRISSVQCQSLSLPFVTFGSLASEIRTQNGLVSWLHLHPTYYGYDLPARRVKINNRETYAYGIDRKKKQTIEYPSLDDPNTMQLIKTYIGSGQIDKLSVNLHTRINKVTLKYDTE